MTLTDPDSEDVMPVAFGPGGTTLATGNADGSVDLGRVRTSRPNPFPRIR